MSLNIAPKEIICQCADNWRGGQNVTKWKKNAMISNFEMNNPVYHQQGSQVESGTLPSLQIIIGVSVFLVYGLSVLCEERAQL